MTIYPSEFGKERMQHEDKFGPGQFLREFDEREGNRGEDGEADEGDPDETISQRRLRLYEMQKMKYYYAVLVCDSVGTVFS